MDYTAALVDPKRRDGIGEQETLVADLETASGVGPNSLGPNSTGPNSVGAALAGGRYRVLALLGEGGMGSVYRARDVELDETVALKMLRRDLVDKPGVIERFRREVKLARRVTHPNVARTYDIGEHEGEKFLTMELVEGEPLSALLARERRLPLGRVVDLASEICAGLAAAHDAGVIHRDLKPDNVLLSSDGRVVITDFGVARGSIEGTDPAATMGVSVGTPAYMAPEQVRGAQDIDARADIYALGVMLFEMLTGELPWNGASAFMVAMARLDAQAPDPRSLRPEIAPGVAETIRRCMAPTPDGRFASATEVAQALAGFAPTGGRPMSLVLSQPPPAVAPQAPAAKSVAVLPFRNGGPPEDEYIADGLTEDLIDTLSMARGLKVRPRAVVMRHKGRDVDPREVGRELDVQVVVEGSVRRVGDRARITARLLSVADGFQLWARRFDRTSADLLVVSDEAADAIAEALTVHAAGHKRKAPTDPVAIELYLQARAELRKLWREPVARAVELFREAAARAPEDGTVLAGYARACSRLWFFSNDATSEIGALARSVAERAVAVAPDNGEAWLALAGVRSSEGNAPEAIRLARVASSKAPGLADPHELLGQLLLEAGRLEQGVSELETALALDPGLRLPRVELARAYGLLGDFARAWQIIGSDTDDPAARISTVAICARLALWSKDPERALASVPDVADTGPDTPVTYAHAVVDAIRTGEIPTTYVDGLRRLMSEPGRALRFRTLLLQLSTEMLAFTMEIDDALTLLEQAVDAGLQDVSWFDYCPVLEPLRKHPRFAAARASVDARAARIRDAYDAPL